ncbi:hypothetical protein HYU12_01670 [Candidatus Woesearchaeota archaeon]|nr:hypothetical protein [Candidatus Woesearchaeota archaeon]
MTKVADVKRRGLQLLIGELIVTFLTIIGTLAFLKNGKFEIIRNIIIVNLIFVAAYITWIKLFGNYEKIYKSGIQEEER